MVLGFVARGFSRAFVLLAVVFVLALVAVATQLPSLAAGALLHPARIVSREPPPAGCTDRTFEGEGIMLRGWFCGATGARRGAIVVLHGIAANRSGAAGLVRRFTIRGLDVVAYDSRAHGESGGDICTYGHYEKQDLRRVIDTLERGPVVLFGTSLGAAVALQEAAEDSRVVGIVAAEVFSDLATVARERLPRLVPGWLVRRAFHVAGERGGFDVARVSPLRAAESITVPVLLIHGAADRDTPPDHSRRVLAALKGPKRLIQVDDAAHNQSVSGAEVWVEIESWVDELLK